MFLFTLKKRPQATKRHRKPRLGIDSLETRATPAAASPLHVSFEANVLTIEGTEENDKIVVTQKAGVLHIKGVSDTFQAADERRRFCTTGVD